ncbi:uncharacterized protein PV09_08804 [Verruconis gallopava]|uniref:Uncharacterized protein n=1 Tax=Verruconis gallopava TaxID=253628 RepID=A0A0D2AKK1_9PEZI|nr:uncharacterized protein PV09_08804 [Verruconis gallopava]KIV99498.1 hypothetical protein PV09_08804 [Verruconis gallopava]
MSHSKTSPYSRKLQAKPLSLPILASIFAMPVSLATAQIADNATAPTTTFQSSLPSMSASNEDPVSSTVPLFSQPSSNKNDPGISDQNDDGDVDDRHSGLINYYFVFLALFVFLAFLGVYFLNRRRRARKLAYRNSAQNALARDMDGWVSNARRWHWRNGSRSERDEGLNELGQAPPAYSAKAHSREPSAEEGSMTNELQIPLPTVAREEIYRDMVKPPAYSEAIRLDSNAGSSSLGRVQPSSASLEADERSHDGPTTRS